CVMSAIETGVIYLVNDGITRNLWSLKNPKDVSSPILERYKSTIVPIAS
ncbi:MAG: curli production assembly/transport protein CsgG, partial [Hafnia sp.]